MWTCRRNEKVLRKEQQLVIENRLTFVSIGPFLYIFLAFSKTHLQMASVRRYGYHLMNHTIRYTCAKIFFLLRRKRTLKEVQSIVSCAYQFFDTSVDSFRCWLQTANTTNEVETRNVKWSTRSEIDGALVGALLISKFYSLDDWIGLHLVCEGQGRECIPWKLCRCSNQWSRMQYYCLLLSTSTGTIWCDSSSSRRNSVVSMRTSTGTFGRNSATVDGWPGRDTDGKTSRLRTITWLPNPGNRDICGCKRTTLGRV